MAKPKEAVKVIVISTFLEVYVNDAAKWFDDVMSIEGVRRVLLEGKVEMTVFVDPRYDSDEVATEVRDLLTREVPQVFEDD